MWENISEVKYWKNSLQLESFKWSVSNSRDCLVKFKYNENDVLISIEIYDYSVNSTELELYMREIFYYDDYENWVGTTKFYSDGSVYNTYKARVDNKGRIVYCETDDGYYFWYYSDGRIPNAEVEYKTTVGNDNKGSFNLNINIPVDSISRGSITITFPEGFMLDETNTNLTIGFGSDFELKITKQANKSWLIEIILKTSKSASFRAGDTKTMLNVAYLVDEMKSKGIYDISINNIIFETKGGNNYPEPNITVPAEVTRWGLGNELINVIFPTVYVNAQTIYIQTENAEQIAIYSITGKIMYEAAIQAGLTTINTAGFPQDIYIVKGSNGWVKKLIMK